MSTCSFCGKTFANHSSLSRHWGTQLKRPKNRRDPRVLEYNTTGSSHECAVAFRKWEAQQNAELQAYWAARRAA